MSATYQLCGLDKSLSALGVHPKNDNNNKKSSRLCSQTSSLV